MKLNEIPREDGETRFIHDLTELASNTYIDLGTTIIREGSPEEWFGAFKEHYEQYTGEVFQDKGYKEIREFQGRTMKMPREDSRVGMTIDYDHSAFKFRMKRGDEEIRDIVYGFLERFFPVVGEEY
tara:strand:- start:469 stop:846 length:378 start_codon:yes stop_codon:yes gene_type:complete